jgi:hypothetical protein
MEERLGSKKIVYKDGSYNKAIEGICFSDGDFIRVETGTDTFYINKKTVMVIKPVSRNDR